MILEALMAAGLRQQVGKSGRDETFESYSNGKRDVEQMRGWEKIHHNGKSNYRES